MYVYPMLFLIAFPGPDLKRILYEYKCLGMQPILFTAPIHINLVIISTHLKSQVTLVNFRNVTMM